MTQFRSFMDLALAEAEAAGARGEVPVGAVLVSPEGEVVAQSGNEMRARGDPTAHAEMLVLRAGFAATGQERLTGFDLYVTLEPCPMCAAALALARIGRLYYGASDPKSGGVAQGPRIFAQSQCHHRPEVYDGLGAEAAAQLLKDFFAAKRGLS